MLPGEHGGGSLLIEVAEKTAVWRGFTALGGILFFFVAERLLAAITSRKKTVKKTPEVTSSEVPDTMFYSEGRVGQKLSEYRKDSQIDIGEKEMMHSEFVYLFHYNCALLALWYPQDSVAKETSLLSKLK